MRYSIEPRDRIYVKGYGFLSFAKNMGKSLSNKYGQKLLDSAKISTTDTIRTASKKAIQEIPEATKKSAKELPNGEAKEGDVEKTTSEKRYISPEERKQIIKELRLVPKKYV